VRLVKRGVAVASAEAMEDLLQRFVLTLERHVKHGTAVTDTAVTLPPTDALMDLLSAISAYGSLGAMGGADAAVCHCLQPLLTRLMKAILMSNLMDTAEVDTTDGAGAFSAEAALAKASEALSNCGTGVTRRSADCVLEVLLGSTGAMTRLAEEQQQQLSDMNTMSTLAVYFGFADYAACETGAMLWAGAVALSLYLIENYQRWVRLPGAPLGPLTAADRAPNCASSPEATQTDSCARQLCSGGRGQRILELGCGPALVSLTVALYGSRVASCSHHCLHECTGQASLQPSEGASFSPTAESHTLESPCELDISDIAPCVVREARRSVLLRNGPLLARMLRAGDEEVEEEEGHDALRSAVTPPSPTAPFQIRCFCLDFSDIPSSLRGRYDLVVGSDIVYDYDIAAHVAPALEVLLCAGGVALICCEAHRDGMQYFADHIRCQQSTSALEVVEEAKDITEVLTRLRMPPHLTASTCQLLVIYRR